MKSRVQHFSLALILLFVLSYFFVLPVSADDSSCEHNWVWNSTDSSSTKTCTSCGESVTYSGFIYRIILNTTGGTMRMTDCEMHVNTSFTPYVTCFVNNSDGRIEQPMRLTSSNPSIAAVTQDPSGEDRITLVGMGTVVITFTHAYEPNISQSFTLIVTDPNHQHVLGNYYGYVLGHFRMCTSYGCNYVEPREAHTGGHADCMHRARCEICGYEYGEYGEHSERHLISSQYLVTPADCCHGAVYKNSCNICKVSIPGTFTTEDFDPDNHGDYGTYVSTYKAPTCSEYGSAGDICCSGCNGVITPGVQIPKLSHTSAEVIDDRYLVSEANCQGPSVYYKSCSVCGEALEETFTHGEADPTNHEGCGTYTQDQIAPTCNTTGYSGDVRCSGCQAVISQGHTLETTEHHYVSTAASRYLCTPANCCSPASYYRHCSICGEMSDDTFKSGSPNSSKHGNFDTYIVNASESTCTERGYTGDVMCEACDGLVRYGYWLSLKDHDYCDIVRDDCLVSEATCCIPAYYYKSCSECGEISFYTFAYGERDYNNHDGYLWLTGVRSASCSSEGYTGDYVCSLCHRIAEYGQVIPREEHTYRELAASRYAVTLPDCCHYGVYYKSCSVCGEAGTDTFTGTEYDYRNHIDSGTYVADARESTCTENGYSGNVYGSECHHLISEGHTIPMTEHTGGTATCSHGAICERCGHSYTASLPHNYVEFVDSRYVISYGDCCHPNIYQKSCSECGCTNGETFEYQVPNSSNHSNYGTFTMNAASATCTAEGYTGDEICLGCGHTVTTGRVIRALGHTGGTAYCNQKAVCSRCSQEYGEFNPSRHNNQGYYKSGAIAATCTSNGYSGDLRCNGCDAILTSGSETFALGHTGSSADCCHKSVCYRCGQEYGEFDLNRHNDHDTYVSGTVAATCTTEGYSGDIYCSGCNGQISTGHVIPALGHTGGTAYCCHKAVCDRCSEEYGEFDPEHHNDQDTYVSGAVNAGCTTDGYSGDIYCTGCNRPVAQGHVIPALGHTGGISYCCHKAVCDRCSQEYGEFNPYRHYDCDTYVSGAIAATCTAGGYTGDTYCTGCDRMVMTGSATSALGHTGGTAYCRRKAVCVRCGQEYGSFKSSNHGNAGTYLSAGTAATCTRNGYTGDYYCSECDHMVSRGSVIPALGHIGGTADCCHGTVCERCGLEYSDPLPHTFIECTDEAFLVSEADCCSSAVYHKSCSNCGYVSDETFSFGDTDPDNHTGHSSYLTGAIAASYTNEGYTGDTYCADCGALIESGETIDMLPSGWIFDGTGWKYLNTNGTYGTAGWKQYPDSNGNISWYYLDNNGYRSTGWKKLNNVWYYMDNEGVMLTGLQWISGKLYSFTASGAMQTGWQQIGSTWYYFDPSGSAYSEWQKINNKWYYFDPSTCEMLAEDVYIIGNTYYGFAASGAMLTGWQKFGNDWYYFESSGAAKANTWYKENNKWYYFGSDAVMYKSGTYRIDGTNYTFDASGVWIK